MNTNTVNMRTDTDMGSSRYLTAGFRLLVAAVLCGLASMSPAGVINIDFNAPGGTSGTYVGTAVAPDSGTTWNGISAAGTTSALVNSSGVVTPVTFTLTYAAFYDGAAPTPASFAPALMNDYICQDPAHAGGNTPFSFGGLVGGSYDLYVYSQNAGFSTSDTITGIGAVQERAINTVSMSSFVLNENYIKYSGLVPANGTITGWVYGVGGLSVNGMQLVGEVPVPEPSCLVLALGFGLLAARKRHRRAPR